ncbi:hypothetical protein QL285_033797 [Trifolium repens]|nr:hypothetical protein QL285_033797 [Trifolium repens]
MLTGRGMTLQEKRNIATSLLQRMNSNRRRFTIFRRFPRQLQTSLHAHRFSKARKAKFSLHLFSLAYLAISIKTTKEINFNRFHGSKLMLSLCSFLVLIAAVTSSHRCSIFSSLFYLLIAGITSLSPFSLSLFLFVYLAIHARFLQFLGSSLVNFLCFNYDDLGLSLCLQFLYSSV